MKKVIQILATTSIIGFLYWNSKIELFINDVKESSKILESTNQHKKIQDGDLIFQISKSDQSKAIQLATASKYSHMGIIFKKENKWYVFEAVQPVKITRLKSWIKRGENKHYVIKRLKNADQILTYSVIQKMKEIALEYLGKPYDIYFEWSDNKIYCSELVWKIYKRATGIKIGKLEKLSDFDLTDSIVRKKLKERYGNTIPLDEKAISPAKMFNSDKLITIKKN